VDRPREKGFQMKLSQNCLGVARLASGAFLLGRRESKVGAGELNEKGDAKISLQGIENISPKPEAMNSVENPPD